MNQYPEYYIFINEIDRLKSYLEPVADAVVAYKKAIMLFADTVSREEVLEFGDNPRFEEGEVRSLVPPLPYLGRWVLIIYYPEVSIWETILELGSLDPNANTPEYADYVKSLEDRPKVVN